jgi:hypothetical protein
MPEAQLISDKNEQDMIKQYAPKPHPINYDPFDIR